MSWVAAAIGGSVIGGVSSYLGANKAADTQAQAAQQALQFQQGVNAQNQNNYTEALGYNRAAYNKTYGENQANTASALNNYTPYLNAGAGAVSKISDLYNLNGGGGNGVSDSGWQSFLQSPDYQFTFNQGRDALQNSAAAKGGLLGGNFARAITDYGQGAASTQFGNYYNRLAGVAGMGQTAANGAAGAINAGNTVNSYLTGSLAGNNATMLGNNNTNSTASSNMIGNTMMGIGQSQASGIVGGTNALTGSLQNGIQNGSFLTAYNNRTNAMNQSSYLNPSGVYTSNNMPGWYNSISPV